jgi:hypothetical protein
VALEFFRSVYGESGAICFFKVLFVFLGDNLCSKGVTKEKNTFYGSQPDAQNFMQIRGHSGVRSEKIDIFCHFEFINFSEKF